MARPILLSEHGFQHIVRHFNGQRSLAEIQMHHLYRTGQWVTQEDLIELVNHLEDAAALDGPTWNALQEDEKRNPVRLPAMAGRSYPAEAAPLRAWLDGFRGGLREPGSPACADAWIVPHIDFQRGGAVYAQAYSRIEREASAEVYIILGVAHQYCRQRFALTLKNFQTPFGILEVDRGMVGRIAQRVEVDLFEDELAHRTEHSIEFQAVHLQHALGDRSVPRIVPILVGSFHDHIVRGTSPGEDPVIRGMIHALRDELRRGAGKVGLIGSIDLCHVGPDFGDRELVDDAMCERVRAFDERMLDRLQAGDAEGWFATAAEVGDRYRVCGLAATYVLLSVLGGSRGVVLDYHQAVSSNRRTCVTIASASLHAGREAGLGRDEWIGRGATDRD
jgi:AmmeMemoRadiSam system protein B